VTILLVISAPIAREDIPVLCACLRTLLNESAAGFVVCDLGALVDPDAVTVDALARLQLTACRYGRQFQLRHACGELRDLLALMGLGDIVRPEAALPLKPRGQAEERKQGRGVEEEGDPSDSTS